MEGRGERVEERKVVRRNVEGIRDINSVVVDCMLVRGGVLMDGVEYRCVEYLLELFGSLITRCSRCWFIFNSLNKPLSR